MIIASFPCDCISFTVSIASALRVSANHKIANIFFSFTRQIGVIAFLLYVVINSSSIEYQFCIARLGLAIVYVLDQIAHETQDQTKVLKSSTSSVSIVSQDKCSTTALASG